MSVPLQRRGVDHYRDGLLRAAEMNREIDRLTQWVNDLQAGMWVNCVYCGHRYGPQDKVLATMQDALYDHIAICPKHPLSRALAERDAARHASLLRAAEICRDQQTVPMASENYRIACNNCAAAIEREANAGAGVNRSSGAGECKALHGGSPPDTTKKAEPAPAD